ncbi:MAG: glycosyltransferase family 39 protein [Candidatus Korobacteraceae bacterium]
MTRATKAVVILWLCFLARGCFYSALLPIWEGYDEPFHFSFIQYLTVHKNLPLSTTPVSREVQASLHLLPLSWEQRLHVLTPPIYTEDSYWQLPAADRRALQEQARAIPPAWGAQTGTAPTMYEAQQAPLYYWIMSGPLRLAAHWSLAARVMLVRILSVLLASLLVPIAYAAAKSFLANRAQALALVAVIICMPELMIDICRAGNESLAIVLYSFLTLLLLLAVKRKSSEWLVFAGIVLGMGWLTKAYFLLAVPAFMLAMVYSGRWASERKRLIRNGAWGIGLAFLISSWWYWRNHVVTGTWSGEENDVAAAHSGLAHLLSASRHVNWIGGIISVVVSHTWFGGWSFLKLPKPIYFVFVAGGAAALFGLAKFVLKDRLRSGPLVVILGLYAFFWVGLFYDIFVVYISTGVSASDGWYMYAVVVPELLLVTWGLFCILPERWHWGILPFLASLFAAIDIYGVHALLLPYYTGIVAHVSGTDIVHPATLAQLASVGPHFILDRLTANKPVWFGPGVFVALFAAYYLATLLTVAISFLAMRTAASGGQARVQK